MNVDDCERIRIAAMTLEDGEVSAIDRDTVAEHLRHCQACRQAVDALDIKSLLPMNLQRVDLPAQMGDRVCAELAKPAVFHGKMGWQRTWSVLAVAMGLLIAVGAGVWMAIHQPADNLREAIVKDGAVDDNRSSVPLADQPPDTAERSEDVSPRMKPELTYRLVAMQPVAPMDYEQIAVNGLMKVHVAKPDPETETPCRLTVLEKVDDEWRDVWSVNPVNPIQPAKAYVSDDGRCVVTIGNASGGPDHTKEQLVIYQEGELKDRYALEDILQGHVIADSIPRRLTCPGGWWRDSFEFVEDQRLCLFVDFAQEWVVVDLNRAALVGVTDSDRAVCEERARKDIYEALAQDVGDYPYPMYRRLVRFLRAEDRSLFEPLLTQPNLLGLPSGYSDEYYMTSNRERDLADLALQAIDAGEKDAIGNSPQPPFHHEMEYKRLGSLKVAATFPLPVTTSDGIIVIWLEPVGGRDEAKPPANAIGIDLEYQFPSQLKSAGKPLSSPVTFYFRGVAPGQYQIRGYWDRQTRHKHLVEESYWRRTGESTVTSDVTIEINVGETAEAEVEFE